MAWLVETQARNRRAQLFADRRTFRKRQVDTKRRLVLPPQKRAHHINAADHGFHQEGFRFHCRRALRVHGNEQVLVLLGNVHAHQRRHQREHAGGVADRRIGIRCGQAGIADAAVAAEVQVPAEQHAGMLDATLFAYRQQESL